MKAPEAKKAILQALLKGPMSALQLIDLDIKCGVAGGFGLYPILRDMVADKMLSSREEAGGPERGGRNRVIYALTDTGRLAAMGQS